MNLDWVSYRIKIYQTICEAGLGASHSNVLLKTIKIQSLAGTFPPPAALIFAKAPRESLEQTLLENNLQSGQWVEWTSPYICLIVKTDDHKVLVDTGAGGLAPTTGRLMQNLQDVQSASEDIDRVILTHGHPDHIGGNTDASGKIAFPNAR